MANSISSEITISSAVSVLTDLLAPVSDFTLNITNEIVGRQATVKVPIVRTDDVARDYSYATGYNQDADSAVDTIDVNLVERIKPFHLVDNDMNKSPLTIQSYAKQNAHEFGRYLLSLVFGAIQADLDLTTPTITAETSVNAGSTALTDIQGLQSALDTAGAPMDRHLVMNSSVNSALMPSSIETFGPGVLQGGRFGNLYGMSTHVTSVTGGSAIGDVHTFAGSSDALVIANRIPEVSGTSTLEEYTPFTVDGIGLQCAYRRYYDAAKGEHFGAFTTIFGCSIAKPEHLAVLTKAS